jgi:hypothetical protein
MTENNVPSSFAGMTPRLARRIAVDFPDCADKVVSLLQQVDPDGQDHERVLAAVVLGADGDQETLQRLIDLTALDWRDVLVNGHLANSDWALNLSKTLGPRH